MEYKSNSAHQKWPIAIGVHSLSSILDALEEIKQIVIANTEASDVLNSLEYLKFDEYLSDVDHVLQRHARDDCEDLTLEISEGLLRQAPQVVDFALTLLLDGEVGRVKKAGAQAIAELHRCIDNEVRFATRQSQGIIVLDCLLYRAEQSYEKAMLMNAIGGDETLIDKLSLMREDMRSPFFKPTHNFKVNLCDVLGQVEQKLEEAVGSASEVGAVDLSDLVESMAYCNQAEECLTKIGLLQKG